MAGFLCFWYHPILLLSLILAQGAVWRPILLNIRRVALSSFYTPISHSTLSSGTVPCYVLASSYQTQHLQSCRALSPEFKDENVLIDDVSVIYRYSPNSEAYS
jgi:hypothetical protein